MIRFERRADMSSQQGDICGRIGEVDMDVAQATSAALDPRA